MLLLDGKIAREFYVSQLQDRVKALSFTPCLAVIQVGDRADSNIYIKGKKSFAEKIGAQIIHIKLEENCTQEEVVSEVEKYNADTTVQGIIVQLPLPAHLNADDIIST